MKIFKSKLPLSEIYFSCLLARRVVNSSIEHCDNGVLGIIKLEKEARSWKAGNDGVWQRVLVKLTFRAIPRRAEKRAMATLVEMVKIVQNG